MYLYLPRTALVGQGEPAGRGIRIGRQQGREGTGTTSQRAGAVLTVVRINLGGVGEEILSPEHAPFSGGKSSQNSSLAMGECRVLLQSVLSGRSWQL